MTRARQASTPIGFDANPISAPDLLREMLTELREIRRLLESRRPASTLSRIDRERLARMLPAIGGVLGSDPFLVRELFEGKAAEAAAIRLVLAGLNAKQIGRLFKRADEQAIDGYMVESQGTETHATLWRVVQVPEFSTVRNLSVPPRPARGLA